MTSSAPLHTSRTHIEEGAGVVDQHLGGVGVVLAIRDVDREAFLPRDEAVAHVFRKRLVLLKFAQEDPESNDLHYQNNI